MNTSSELIIHRLAVFALPGVNNRFSTPPAFDVNLHRTYRFPHETLQGVFLRMKRESCSNQELSPQL